MPVTFNSSAGASTSQMVNGTVIGVSSLVIQSLIPRIVGAVKLVSLEGLLSSPDL